MPQITPQSQSSGIIPAALSLLFLALSFIDVKPSTGQRVYYAFVILGWVCLLWVVWHRAGIWLRWLTTILAAAGITVSILYLIA